MISRPWGGGGSAARTDRQTEGERERERERESERERRKDERDRERENREEGAKRGERERSEEESAGLGGSLPPARAREQKKNSFVFYSPCSLSFLVFLQKRSLETFSFL